MGGAGSWAPEPRAEQALLLTAAAAAVQLGWGAAPSAVFTPSCQSSVHVLGGDQSPFRTPMDTEGICPNPGTVRSEVWGALQVGTHGGALGHPCAVGLVAPLSEPQSCRMGPPRSHRAVSLARLGVP